MSPRSGQQNRVVPPLHIGPHTGSAAQNDDVGAFAYTQVLMLGTVISAKIGKCHNTPALWYRSSTLRSRWGPQPARSALAGRRAACSPHAVQQRSLLLRCCHATRRSAIAISRAGVGRAMCLLLTHIPAVYGAELSADLRRCGRHTRCPVLPYNLGRHTQRRTLLPVRLCHRRRPVAEPVRWSAQASGPFAAGRS